MTNCPSCGSTNLNDRDDTCLDCGTTADPETRIASWIGPASVPPGPSAETPEAACTACGYSGEMIGDCRGTACPACGVVLPGRRSDVTTRVTRLIGCPECGRQIGITVEDEGKTVICPGCSYFLGTPSARATGSTSTGRRPRGR